VPVAVRGVSTGRYFIDARAGPSAKICVGEIDAGVDDVCGDAGACVVVGVAVVQRKVMLIDAVESPCRRRLSNRRACGHDLIRFDSHDARIARNGRSCGGGDVLDRKPFERGLVDVLQRSLVQAGNRLGDSSNVGHVVAKSHDIVAGDRDIFCRVDRAVRDCADR